MKNYVSEKSGPSWGRAGIAVCSLPDDTQIAVLPPSTFFIKKYI